VRRAEDPTLFLMLAVSKHMGGEVTNGNVVAWAMTHAGLAAARRSKS